MEKVDVIGAANALAEQTDADVFLLNAPFELGVDRIVVRAVSERRRRKNVVLILVTEGGDAAVAYRISRVFQAQYERFTAIVSGWCKSAGTLCVVGANEIAFGEFGELGPLDVQYLKKDEISEVASGLDVSEALNKLQSHAFRVFEKSMLGIIQRSGGQVSFKLAAEVAAKMAVGVCEPLYRQIDPVILGDLERSMTIAKDYGKRLLVKGKNSSHDQLAALAESYPSHGFVIDLREAENLFNNVRPCSESECKLLNALQEVVINPRPQPVATYLSAEAGERDEIAEGVPHAQAPKSANDAGGEGSDAGNSEGAGTASASGSE